MSVPRHLPCNPEPVYAAHPTPNEALALADDPYTLLGVPRTATDKQVHSAFLKLAKTSHPDVNPGDKKAEERFKAISAAHDLLSDPARRARFDRGEIDATGQDVPPQGFRPGARGAASPFAADDMGDILSSMFSARGGPQRPRRGQDAPYTLTITFLDAVRGATQRLSLPGGTDLDIRIPPGTESGDTLRLRGKGGPGTPAGDALITLTVASHSLYRREGADIHLELPVTLTEAVLGAKVIVPTVAGPVTMAVPPGSDTGTRLRLRGRGVPEHGPTPAGDAYATLRVTLGPPNEALKEFLATWTQDFNPRASLEDS